MVIEELTREPGTRRNMIPTGKTFSSLSEVLQYCLEWADKQSPLKDAVSAKFRIVDSGEVFFTIIDWDSNGEAYVSQSITLDNKYAVLSGGKE